MKPFFISVPHAGEVVPPAAYWLADLPEPVLMCDADRYVDELYEPAAKKSGIPFIVADIHRYVVDLNRLPDDVDQNSVEGSANPAGKFTTGLLWQQTTTGIPLLQKPITQKLHQELVQKYFRPFHQQIENEFARFRKEGYKQVYHLDAHSMPSKGTAAHRDPGGQRAQIVVGDRDGTSCDPRYKDLVVRAYKTAGFEVAYNWPYKGGRITETYGQPQKGQHTIQIEMNRELYMDEVTKKRSAEKFTMVQKQISHAIELIAFGLPT